MLLDVKDILFILIGAIIAHYFEELKQKKIDIQKNYTIERIDIIRSWGEVIECQLHNTKPVFNKTQVQTLFNKAKGASIRFDRMFQTDWTRVLDATNPLIMKFCNEKKAGEYNYYEEIEKLIKIISPFLDEVDFWREKLFARNKPNSIMLIYWHLSCKNKKKQTPLLKTFFAIEHFENNFSCTCNCEIIPILPKKG